MPRERFHSGVIPTRGWIAIGAAGTFMISVAVGAEIVLSNHEHPSYSIASPPGTSGEPRLPGELCEKDGALEAVCSPQDVIVNINAGERGPEAAKITSSKHPRMRVQYEPPKHHKNSDPVSKFYIEGDGVKPRTVFVYSGKNASEVSGGQVTEKFLDKAQISGTE